MRQPLFFEGRLKDFTNVRRETDSKFARKIKNVFRRASFSVGVFFDVVMEL